MDDELPLGSFLRCLFHLPALSQNAREPAPEKQHEGTRVCSAFLNEDLEVLSALTCCQGAFSFSFSFFEDFIYF